MTNRPQQFHETQAFLDTLLQVGMGPHDWWREKRTYAFRGQANATWPLVPKRFRPYAKGEAVPTVAQQAQREFQETKQFFDLADDHGLQIPEDNQQLRRTLAEPYGTPRDWPDPEFWSFLAVGQHYGFPTRLLDWSWNPLVAAYFAAVEAAAWVSGNVKNDVTASELAVWVLDLAEFHGIRADPNGYDRLRAFPFWLITAPGYSNPNLAAQRGCFTLYQPHVESVTAEEELDTRPLDEVYPDKIKKLTLAIEEAPRLLWLLDRRHGVTAASLFPGFGGATRALAERELQEPIAAVTAE